MKTATITDFRKNIKKHLDGVQSDQDILILSGPKKKDFVILTLNTFNAMEETAYLLSTPANTAQLMRSIADHKAGNVRIENIDEHLKAERIGSLSAPKARAKSAKKRR